MQTCTLANFWHPIATAVNVTEQPKSFVLLGEKIVAYRDGQGVVAFKDRCIHRGVALSLGSVKGGHLTCAYHGWQYDRAGICIHIPALPAGASIPRKARVTAYRAEEAYGLIWVALADPMLPLPTWPDDAWQNPAYRVFFVKEYVWKSSAGRAIENAVDFAHFNFVHKGYTELADGPEVHSYDVHETNTGLEYAYEDGRIRREYTLHAPFTLHDKKYVIRADKGGTWSEGSAPETGNTTILTFIASPVEEKLTHIYVFVGRNHALETDDRAFAQGFDTIMDQDRAIVESQRPEQIPTDLKVELHLKVPDAASIAYRRLLGRIKAAAPFGA